MQISTIQIAAAVLGFCIPVQCFQHGVRPASSMFKTTKIFANEREDFIPETSFGAEVVPEGQRPVNEYLEMRRSPLFEWASNEVGTKGVSFTFQGEVRFLIV